MTILLEIASVALLAILVSRFASEPIRGRTLNLLKAWVTVRAFWLLLTHPVKLESGDHVIAWKLIQQTLQNIDAGTFWLFVALAAGIKFIGILASMYRWTVLLRGQGIQLPFKHIFGSFLIGRFIGTFLPSTAGLDGYKLYDASRFSGRTVETTAATFLEKILGVTGIFLTYLVSLPFGVEILRVHLGDQTGTFAAISVALVAGIIGSLLAVLFFPGLVQWGLENVPIPGKQRLEGIILRLSNAAAAYRDQKGLVVQALFLSFVVHFTTAAMYYFTALAIGAAGADFWQVTFGSSIQILATVLSPFTIAGEGIREAAQYLLLGNQLGAGNAIVSAALGFWAAEALTLAGGIFWWIRPKDYTPDFCLVDGEQVDYAAAAKAAASLESEEERAKHNAQAGCWAARSSACCRWSETMPRAGCPASRCSRPWFRLAWRSLCSACVATSISNKCRRWPSCWAYSPSELRSPCSCSSRGRGSSAATSDALPGRLGHWAHSRSRWPSVSSPAWSRVRAEKRTPTTGAFPLPSRISRT